MCSWFVCQRPAFLRASSDWGKRPSNQLPVSRVTPVVHLGSFISFLSELPNLQGGGGTCGLLPPRLRDTFIRVFIQLLVPPHPQMLGQLIRTPCWVSAVFVLQRPVFYSSFACLEESASPGRTCPVCWAAVSSDVP